MRRIIAACAVATMGITGIAVATASPAKAEPCILIRLQINNVTLLCI